MNDVSPEHVDTEKSDLAAPVEAEPQYCVLLIEDDEDQMLMVKYSLEECGQGRYKLEWENRLSLGKERLLRGGVDVVLLDLGLPGCSGAASYASIRAIAPEVPIVVLTSDDSEQTESVVMTCGAEDYLVKEEISAPHLLRSIRSAIYRHRNRTPAKSPQPSRPSGLVIGFVGAKGGTGTTSTVLNFAAVLGPERATIALETAVNRSGFAQQLTPDRNASAAYPVPGPAAQAFPESVLPTCLEAGVLFEPLAGCLGTQAAVEQAREVVSLAARNADFVLADAGSQWDPVAQAVLAKCQSIVLVVDREPAAFAAVRDWAQRFGELPAPANGTHRDISLLIVNRSGLAAHSFLERMQRSFSWPVLSVIPHASDRVAWAIERYRPLAYLDPADPVSAAIREATTCIVEQAASWATTA